MIIQFTFDFHRDPKREPAKDEPAAPNIYDVSNATIERKPQWDHDTKPPIGFTRQETT